MRKISSLLLAAVLVSTTLAAQARDGDAIIGSILGGATGAVIGHNVGGRDGAIIGSAIGAAAGVAIATDRPHNSGYDDDGYHRARRDDYDDDRYDSRYDRRYSHSREVVVVESPRHYYRGNDFVYGVPEHYDNGRHRGWDRYHDRSRNVVIVQQSPRYDRYERYEGNYCPPPRRW